MKNWRTFIIIIIIIFIFWFIKFYLKFPTVDAESVGIILTITSVLFGLLAAFFISQLWTRYTEIREAQSIRCANGIGMIGYAKYLFKNKKFEEEFKKLVEKSSVADESIEWGEEHLVIPYLQMIGNLFEDIKIENEKDRVYLEKLLDNYDVFLESYTKLDTLGKEKLLPTEWFIMVVLSAIIGFSILFLDVSYLFSQAIILVFPPVIVLTLSIIYDLNNLSWSKETISLEPNARIFDALGVKRFYLKKKKHFISSHIKDYRTEDDLVGDLKEVYLKIIKSRRK